MPVAKELFKLCLSSNNSLLPIDLLHFRINAIMYNHNSEERLVRSVNSNPHESYFLINFSEETEIVIENFIENTYIHYPLQAVGTSLLMKYNILMTSSIKAVKNDIIRDMGLKNRISNTNYQSLLLIGKKGSGKKDVLSMICKKYGLNYLIINTIKFLYSNA